MLFLCSYNIQYIVLKYRYTSQIHLKNHTTDGRRMKKSSIFYSIVLNRSKFIAVRYVTRFILTIVV